MSKKDLQKTILGNDGFIIAKNEDDKLDHLLAKSYDLIIFYNIQNKKLLDDIKSVFILDNDDKTSLVFKLFNGDCFITEEKQSEAMRVLSNVYNFFKMIAPKGYQFETDKPYIGWVKEY